MNTHDWDKLLRKSAKRSAKVILPKPDCRTCAHHYLNIYENNACEEYAMCTNADRYEPLPPVRLWRTT